MQSVLEQHGPEVSESPEKGHWLGEAGQVLLLQETATVVYLEEQIETGLFYLSALAIVSR